MEGWTHSSTSLALPGHLPVAGTIEGRIKCFVVEPVGAEVLAKEKKTGGSKDDASEVSTASNDGGCGHVI